MMKVLQWVSFGAAFWALGCNEAYNAPAWPMYVFCGIAIAAHIIRQERDRKTATAAKTAHSNRAQRKECEA